MLRGGAEVARQAHNLKAVGSIPAPATSNLQPVFGLAFFIFVYPGAAKTFTNYTVSQIRPQSHIYRHFGMISVSVSPSVTVIDR